MIRDLLLLPVSRVWPDQWLNDVHARLRRCGRTRAGILCHEYSGRDLAIVRFYKREGRAIHGIEREIESAV